MTGPSSSRSGGRRGRHRAPMAEINVTPLVDVMLVLLIIFMVTAPLLTSGVSVRLPESRAKGLDQDQKPKILSIDKTGAVFLDDIQVSDSDLPAKLTALRGTDPEVPQIYLRAETSLDYGRVMFVMGELNQAGLNKVALVSVGAGEGGSSQNGGGDAPSDTGDVSGRSETGQ